MTWGGNFDSPLSKEIEDHVEVTEDFMSSPYIFLPFRLPTLDEKKEDSELSDLLDATIKEANPDIFTLHSIIGNFFKPTAVLASLGGKDHIQSFLTTSPPPQLWTTLDPGDVHQAFDRLHQQVVKDISHDNGLSSFLRTTWFPTSPVDLSCLTDPDWWHKVRRLPLVRPAVQDAPTFIYAVTVTAPIF